MNGIFHIFIAIKLISPYHYPVLLKVLLLSSQIALALEECIIDFLLRWTEVVDGSSNVLAYCLSDLLDWIRYYELTHHP